MILAGVILAIFALFLLTASLGAWRVGDKIPSIGVGLVGVFVAAAAVAALLGIGV